jgi:tRNA threonylcarbamoyladenosine biosynthesis protein TsaB
VRAARALPQALPRARALLPLAKEAWAGGCAIDAAQALPLYLRDKVALTTAERLARGGRA